MFSWSEKNLLNNKSGLEDGELDMSDEVTSDVDYSPGSLVIDAVEKATSSTSSSSAPPTPPIEMIQNTLEFDTHPIFGTEPLPSYTPPSNQNNQFLPSATSSLLPPHIALLAPPSTPPQQQRNPSMVTGKFSSLPRELSPHQAPSQLPLEHVQNKSSEIVKFVTKIDVASEGSAPVDCLCIYQFLYGAEYIEILTRQTCSPLIPIKNVYLKAIPGLKQNVLSARISKLGIRSLVLSEPYVSTVKKLNLGLNGSSHYITIKDFIKICNYFKKQSPSFILKFDYITSLLSPADVVQLFNNPDNTSSKDMLSRLRDFKNVVPTNAVPGIGGGASVRGSGSPSRRSEGSSVDKSIDLSEIDARRLSLPNGSAIYVLLKGGVVYLPNPELAKVLPAVSRTAMEHIRTSYGITVMQATKTDMGALKYLGVVSVKAGRTLLYKVSDVGTMFRHWKSVIPDFVQELIDGKIPEDRVIINSSSHPHHHTPSSIHPSSLTATQVAPNHTHSGGNHTPFKSGKFASSNSSLIGRSSGIYSNTSLQVAKKGAGLGNNTMLTSSPTSHQGVLNPENFQLPVQILNSLTTSQGMTTPSSSGHVMGHVSGSSTPSSSSSLPRLEKVKRRNSSVSSTTLDDQNLEYSSIQWDDQTLTLLGVRGEEPYLAVPELVQKIFHYQRSYISVQLRNSLGVVFLSATSLQIHALRARGSVDNQAGTVKLVSLSDAIKLAESGNFNVPTTVNKRLSMASQVPIQQLFDSSTVLDSFKPSSVPVLPMASMEDRDLLLNNDRASQIPAHPDIFPTAPDWRLDGSMCRVKWGEDNLVVYVTDTGQSCMGLFQVYEVLFKRYVTRMNFKMRMRKLSIRSNRAPSSVRLKLVELGALPSHCPVCGLITVREMERLAKSYGVEPPQVFYDKFLSGKSEQKLIVSRRVQPMKLLETTPLPPPPSSQPSTIPSDSNFPQNLFSYQFDPTEDPTPSLSQPRSSNHTPTQISRPPRVGRAREYGIVPYLESERGTFHNTTPPNLIMTSLGTISTNQIHSVGLEPKAAPLIVSISREHAPSGIMPSSTDYDYNYLSSPVIGGDISGGVSTTSANGDSAPHSNSRIGGAYPYHGGSRGKVLHNLAKKISQKSRKFTSSMRNQQQQWTPPTSASSSTSGTPNLSGGSQFCPSCGRENPPSQKKRCGYCNELMMGVACAVCSKINPLQAKSCDKCSASISHAWKPQQEKANGSHDRHGEVPGSEPTSDSSSHPTSPLSPKYSAPPIRNAVLKSLFPQQSGASSSKTGSGSGQQVLMKTGYSGSITSARKCLECGELNSKMAKKCIHCRSHLQGRACTSCGRPNLNHVTECYKCGSPLPPASSSKWMYGGTRQTNRAQTMEERVLASRAPVPCMRCDKVRSSGYFKCGRCGDAYTASPLVNPPWDQSHDTWDRSHDARASKKRKISSDGPKEQPPENGAGLSGNLLSTELQDQLTPLLISAGEEIKSKMNQAREEFEAVDSEYRTALAEKETAQNNFNDVRAELDGMISQIEVNTRQLNTLLEVEEEAKKEIEVLPLQVEKLKSKVEALSDLIVHEVCET